MKRILIVIASTIVMLMSIVFIAFDLHRTSEETTISQFQEHQLLHAQQAANLIESYLRTRTTGMQALSSFGSLRQRDLKKMRADLQDYLGYLKEKQVKAMSVFDENGTIVYSTSDSAIGRNYAQCDFSIWAKKPENRGKFFISPILRATLPGEEAASFRALLVTPLYQINNLPRNRRPSSVKVPTGEFIGALSITVDLGELLAKQLALVNSRTKLHDVWVIHEDGTLLFESEHPEMVLRNIHQNNQTCSQCHTSFDYIKMILAKRQGAVDYELKNLPKKLAAFAPMEFENARWIVAMNTPYDEIIGSLRKGLMETILLMVIVAFVFVGGSILFYRSERLKIRAEEEARQWREKRALEKKIRQSEERYQTIVETAHDLVLTVDTQGNFTFINKQGEEITGYKIEDWIGKSFTLLILPEDLPKAQTIFLNALQGIPQSYDVRIIGSDGKIIILSLNTVPLYEDEKVVGTVSFGRDVTEQKRVENALRESEERYRRLVELSPDAIAVHSEGKFVFVNAAGVKLIGAATSEELIGKSALDVVHPDYHEIVKERFRQMREEGKEASLIEEKFIRLDGTVVDVEVAAIPFTYQNKPAVQVVIRDITERKRAEARLAKLNECLLSFGADPNENINRLVAFCGEQLQATCALYNRLEGDRLHALGQWHAPANFVSVDNPDGHICYDVIRSGKEDARVIRDLLHTQYAQTDPNVVRYGLKTYIGKAVDLEGAYVGSLCVVYQDDRIPSKDDLNLLGIVASAVGVEEKRKRTEKTIAMLAHAIRSINECVSITDNANNILFVNNAFLQTYGYDRGELQGKHISFVRSPNNPPVVEEILSATLRGGWQGELLNRRKDGSEFPVFLSTSVIRDESGELLSLIGVATDITERKQAEKGLRETKDQLEAVLYAIADGVTVLDASGRLIYANHVVALAAGYPSAEEMIRSYDPARFVEQYDLVDEDGNPLPATQLPNRLALEGKPAQPVVVGYRFKATGAARWSVVQARPIVDPGGKVQFVVTVMHDITERMRSEEELKRQMEELERFNKLAVGRELKMVELKKRIQELEAEREKQ